MKETTPAAMPPCVARWCRRFDTCFKNPAQKNGVRPYIGGVLGENEMKNLTQNSK
ncbi:MAG: IS701 family transposase, partial [Microcystis sp.]